MKIKLLAAVGLVLAATVDVLAGKFSVVETPAGPRLAIDGVPQNAVAALPDPFVAPKDYAEKGCVKGMRLMADAGVRLFSNVWSVRNRPHDWWLGEGKYDWQAFDAMAQCLLDACPDGWIMPRIKIEPPEWWVVAHPEELSTSGAEVKATSKPWRELYRRMLRDVLAHAEASAYADRIVGWHIGGFHCGEWQDWKRPRSEFPSVDERYENTPLAPMDATAARRKYQKTRAREVADVLLDAAKLVKDMTRGEKIVCAFFGYGWPDHEDMMRVIRSGLVDVFSSPAYYGAAIRGPGAPGVQQACYTASFALHGRLFMEEADPRTHLVKAATEAVKSAALKAGKTANLAESVGVIRRIIGKNLAQGTGLWWFLIAGNETFDTPEIMESVKVGVEEMRRTLGERVARPFKPDVAVFTRADEYATSLVCHSLPLYEYRYRLHTSLLPRCGVAYDSYELSDIVDPRVGDYSVYVLPNAFSLSDEEKEAIARLEAAGKRIVRIPEPIGVDELRARLATAGAHVYLDTGDVVFAGRGYLTVHASNAGVKRIRLPYPCDIKEIFGAAPERKGVTEFVEEMAFGETRVYALRPSCRKCDKLAVAIVLPEMPTASESFAAKELKYHLEKATGETVSIVAEGESVGRDDPIAPHASTSNLVGRDDPIAPPAGSCDQPVRRFYVGNTKALANAGIDYASLQVEERVVKGVGGDVYLAGGELPGFDEIVKTEKFRTSYALAGGGTLYAVYDFLENEMGVRWIWPGELGEVIPKRGIPVMNGVERRGREPLLKRELRGNLEGMRRITIANKLYGWKDPANARREVESRELWMTRNRCGYRRRFSFGHAFTDWYRRYPDHPEYFAMQPSGLRGRFADLVPSDSGNKYYPLCVSNTNVHDRIVKDWAERRDEYVNCCENDSPGFCTCANCRAWDAPDPRFAAHPYWNGKIREVTSRNRFFMAKAQWGDEGTELEKAEPPSVSDRYVRFYNAVLEKARAVDPRAEVCAYAYANYVMPPKETRVADGVVISFVPNITFPYSRAGSDEFRACWLGWNRCGATQMMYRPNYMFGGANMPYSQARRMAADVNFAFAHGMIGVDHDSLLGAWSAQAMKNYVAARLLREPDAPYKEIAVEFVSAFGAAARDVAEYCLMLEAIDDKFPDDEWTRICKANPSRKGSPGGGWRNFVTIVADLYSEEWFAKADAILMSAEGKVDDVERARVGFLRKGLRDGLLTFRARIAQKSGDQAAFDAAFKAMVDYRASVEADNVCAWAWFADMEEKVAGWPHATQKYRQDRR